MDWGASLKISTHITHRWPSATGGPNIFPSLSQGKVKVGCWLVGGSVVKRQLHPNVLKLKCRDSIWTGVFQSKFQLIQPIDGRVQIGGLISFYHYLSKKSKSAVGCSVGRWSKVNFTQRFRNLNCRIVYGLGWFTQNFNSYGPKMAECNCGPRLVHIIISEKS